MEKIGALDFYIYEYIELFLVLKNQKYSQAFNAKGEYFPIIYLTLKNPFL